MLQLRTALMAAAFGIAAVPCTPTIPIDAAGAYPTITASTAAATAGTPPNFTPAEVAPVCSTAQKTFVFYMSPSDKAYRYDSTMINRLRTYTRQLTGFIRSEGLASSGNTKGPLLKVACNSDGSIRVGGLRSTTTSAADSFDTIKQDLIKAGFNDPNTKYLVFYDDPNPSNCGLGDVSQDDRKVTTNANNVGAKYAVVYGNASSTAPCWTWYVALHELFHTMGAVQNGAPGSSGAGHCNDGIDIMCYDDDGPTSHYTETRCTKAKLDCGYDTYFDTATEPGEWLATHWNLGWSGNSYLKF
jgi:hypothetical protein